MQRIMIIMAFLMAATTANARSVIVHDVGPVIKAKHLVHALALLEDQALEDAHYAYHHLDKAKLKHLAKKADALAKLVKKNLLKNPTLDKKWLQKMYKSLAHSVKNLKHAYKKVKHPSYELAHKKQLVSLLLEELEDDIMGHGRIGGRDLVCRGRCLR